MPGIARGWEKPSREPWRAPWGKLPLQFGKTRDWLGSHRGCAAGREMRLILHSFGDSSVPLLPLLLQFSPLAGGCRA